MRKKLSKDIPAETNDPKPAPDTLFPMNQMECPRCRAKINGYVKDERAECVECGQGYFVVKARKVVFGLA